MKRARTFRVVILACIAVLAACLAILFLRDGERSYKFYDVSAADLSGRPGGIIRSEPMRAFAGARAWRIVYRSTGLNGEPIAVSGVVVAPDAGPAAGGYPVVAWAHPTTGLARKCAPSLDADVFNTIPGLQEMVKRGFVVTATDYVGLGTAGVHPYLVGLSAGRSVLDSVRAARALTKAEARFAVWGHSQGGHAVLWAGEIAADYAPDLRAVGVAAAAPASDLASLFEDDRGTPAGQAFSALALLSWSRVYGAALDTIIDGEARTAVDWIGAECMTNRVGLAVDDVAIRFLKTHFLKADPVTTEPWKDYVMQNTPTRLPPHVPLLIAQGLEDTVVLPAVTRDFVNRICRQGGVAQVVEMHAGHLSVASLSAGLMVQWIADRFAGRPASSQCTEKIAR